MSNDYYYVAGLKSGSTEGQLASSYTNWVNAEIKANAEYIAFTAFNGGNGMSLEAAKAIQSALASGQFNVTDLFLAASAKTGPIADIVGTPKPVLHVNGVDIDLAQFFQKSTETVSWDAGSGKSLVTQTREFLDKWGDGTATTGWDVIKQVHINEGPTAPAQSLDVAEGQPGANPVVDLLGTAADTDGGTLALVAGSIDLGSLPTWISLVGNTLVINQNAPELDHLNVGDQESVTVNYSVSDGQGGQVDTSVTIKLNGTNDLPTVEAIKADAVEGAGDLPVNLLAGASDVDDAAASLHVVDGSLAVQGGGVLPTWLSVDAAGNLHVNQNDAAFDHLNVGDTDTFAFDFQVADGHDGVRSNTVTIKVAGTNDGPTVDGPLHIAAAETQSTFDAAHNRTNGDLIDTKSIDLLQGAHDVDDGAVLSISNITYNGGNLPEWAKLDGNTLVIDQNSRALDDFLKSNETKSFTFDFQVTDENGATTPNSVVVDLTGTKDQYHTGHFTAHDEDTFYASGQSGGNVNGVSLEFSLPNDDGFDFNMTGQLVATSHIVMDKGNETSTVSDYTITGIDWSTGSLQLGKVGNDIVTTATANLGDAALEDHKVDFNVSFGGQTSAADHIDVVLNVQGDYWLWS